MNTTPPPQMFEAMAHLVDQFVGPAPADTEKTTAADERRRARRMMFDILHNLVRLSMRVGVARYLREFGVPIVKDTIEPDRLAKAVRDEAPPSNVIQIAR